MPSAPFSRAAKLAELRRMLDHAGCSGDAGEHPLVVSTGLAELDRLLPHGGLVPGELVEWRGDRGSGVARLAWHAVGGWLDRGGFLAVIDPAEACFPPAWSSPDRTWRDMVWVRPATPSETWLAWEESLRSPGVAAVWGWIPRLPARFHRRFQLACEQGGHVGMLLRPGAARRAPSWSAVIWDVEPLPAERPAPPTSRSWRVRLVKCRGGQEGKEIVVHLPSPERAQVAAFS